MRPAINDLAQYADERLFTVVSEGIGHIIKNATELDRVARRLYEADENHGSNIMHRLAEEESAKALVLVDFVRCPVARSKDRIQTTKHFYDHVGKGIYAKAVTWRPADFQDICSYVNFEKAGFYLGGPYDVDWVFRNTITADREWAMYVDYVQDVTVEDGKRSWHYPDYSYANWLGYQSPWPMRVSDALKRCGATSTDGLKVIAAIWRDYEPQPTSSRVDLMGLVVETLETLKANGLAFDSSSEDERTILEGWAFPMWSLDLRVTGSRSSENQLLRDLRKRRKDYIERWLETEQQRDPHPRVTRETIERLSDAFCQWQSDIDEIRDAHFAGQEGGLRIEPSTLRNQYHKLDSYVELERMLGELTESERVELLALAWFSRQRPFDWPQHHRHAIAMIKNLDYKYQTGLGKDWLRGLDLWESAPQTPYTLDLA